MNTNVEQTFVNIAKNLHAGRPQTSSGEQSKTKKTNLKTTQLKK
jgi:hypothetical protein